MNRKLVIVCAVVAYVGCALSAPSDPFSQIISGFIGCVIVASFLISVLSRNVIRETKPPVQKLIAWLVTLCVIAISFATWYAIMTSVMMKGS